MYVRVERRDHDIVVDAVDRMEYVFGETGLFEFDGESYLRRDDVEYLLQFRDAFLRTFDADRGEVSTRQFVDVAVTVADWGDVIMIDHDQLARPTPANVELDGVDAVGPDRIPDRAHGVSG